MHCVSKYFLLQRPQLESLKLQQSVRNSVQDAVEGLGGRVTVGDVSARAGVKISEAEEALNALAADASGTLEVSLPLYHAESWWLAYQDRHHLTALCTRCKSATSSICYLL